ncbi:MAG: site-specific integrase, partial [Nitrosomonadales bacterium]|nr:site-specific integrase [Nitrosomonadales bacterium]
SGKRVFYVYGRINGKPEDIKIGEYPTWTQYTARTKAREIIGGITRGDNPNARKREGRAELTLGSLFDEYLIRYAIPHGKKTIQDMKDNFARYLGEVPDVEPKKHGKKRGKPLGAANWQNRKLSAITRLDVQKLHSDLGVHSGNATANRTLELLRAIFNKGISWGMFKGGNPCEGVTKFSLQSRDRFLHGDELARFFESVADEPNESIRDYVLMSLLTGARKANILAMRWEHIDLSRGTWFLPDTKNGTSQTIPLTTQAKAILEARSKNKAGEFVFAGDGITGHMTSPKRAWAKILAKAELKDLRLHDLRRTLGSWQAATGASLVVIGKTLNHKDISTTSIYSRLSLDPVRESMETAQAAMMAAGGITPKAEVLKFKKSSS